MKHSPKQPDLSIVIGALREEKRIGKTLETLAQFLYEDALFKSKLVEVVVVTADSADRTHEIVQEKGKLFETFVHLKPGPAVGKGRDIQYGMLRAKGKAVIHMDADLATPLHHLAKFYKAYEEGADLIIGTRNLRKHHKSLIRRAVANGGNALFRIMGGVWVEDSQCGFKLFSANASQLCFSRMTIQKWGFDMEVLAIARANKLKITTFRINDWHDMPDGTFEGSVIKNSVHSLRDLTYIGFNRLRRRYVQSRSDGPKPLGTKITTV